MQSIGEILKADAEVDRLMKECIKDRKFFRDFPVEEVSE